MVIKRLWTSSHFEDKFIEGTADRIVSAESLKFFRWLWYLDWTLSSNCIRALREQASEEMVVASLLHDTGDDCP